MTTTRILLVAALGLGLTACDEKKPAAPVEAPKPAEVKKPVYDALARTDFNVKAQAANLPLFWRADANANKALDPDELVVVVSATASTRDTWVTEAGFTPAFEAAWKTLTTEAAKPTDDAEGKRRAAVMTELAQGRPTLVENDFTQASAQDKALLNHLTRAASLVDGLFFKQMGAESLRAKLPADDAASQALFYRNHGPWCAAPKTENDPACSAVTGGAPRRSGLYPEAIQADDKFCQMLEKQKNAKELMGHFSVVVADGEGFKAVPYTEFYKDDMEAVAKELDSAAAAITTDDEAAFKAYLTAAAQGFRTNDWEPANAAWVAMNATNSKWYLRIAPDEVYYEPCAWKAGFAADLARINPDSLAWQQKLEPVKLEMEQALAKLAGPPYKARDVKFKLPDFIDVVVNAGDKRPAHGATIGQSLPNWGKVAEKGGRTVVMTNLYTDADSQASMNEQMSALFCEATQKQTTTDAAPFVFSIVLHEAAHNLGPSHEYKVKGKEDDEVFGGKLASTLEELKAQTAALYFPGWLVKKGVITEQLANQAHLRDVAWAFGHVSRGMYDAGGNPKNYSQLASMQLGHLLKDDVLLWRPGVKAANGTDEGCFDVQLDKWDASVGVFARRVLAIKGKGDKKDAEKMKAELVDAKDEWAALRDIIAERWLRAPKATFVYSVRY